MIAAVLVVTSVHHGNTMKVAEAMASATGMPIHAPGEEARSLIEQGASPGFGSGIFFGHHNDHLLDFVENLPVFHERPAFIFSTSGTGLRPARLFGRHYHGRLIELLSARGFNIVDEFGCKGYDTYGPWGKLGGIAKGRPSEKELEQARAFAVRMQDAIGSNDQH